MRAFRSLLDLHSEMELRAELDAAFQRVMASGRFVCAPSWKRSKPSSRASPSVATPSA
ncbi:MAG: hypothetical protein U0263_06990 [Polyangiaceae bacterium]